MSTYDEWDLNKKGYYFDSAGILRDFCDYAEGHKLFIPPEIDLTLDDIKYLRKVAQDKKHADIKRLQVEVEDRRVLTLIRIGKWSFFGTVLASCIGAGTLVWLNVFKKDKIQAETVMHLSQRDYIAINETNKIQETLQKDIKNIQSQVRIINNDYRMQWAKCLMERNK